MFKLKPREVILGIGMTTVLTAIVLMGISNLYLSDVYNLIQSLSIEEFNSYVYKGIKIYMLFGFVILSIGSAYIFIKAHAKADK